MNLIAKIIIDEQTILSIVPTKYYSIVEDELINNTEQMLLQMGYQSGKFDITYYRVGNRVYNDLEFEVTKVSPNKKECKCTYDVESTTIEDLINQQTQLLEDISQFKFVGYNGNNLTVFDYVVYNQFEQQFIMRSQQKIYFSKLQSFRLYKTEYQPVKQTHIIISNTTDDEGRQIITLNQPLIYQVNNSKGLVDYINIASLQTSGSTIEKQLVSSYMTQKIFYDYTKPETYIHFGTYTSRLNSLIRKFQKILINNYESIEERVIELSDIKNYKQTSLINKQINQIINNFNTFQRQIFVNQLQGFIDDGVNIDDQVYLTWKQNKYVTAQSYDSQNIHKLVDLVPRGIIQSQNNQDFIVLVNMIGDTFDQYWSAIKSIPSLTAKLQFELQHFDISFLKDILLNMGHQFVMSFNDESLYEIYKHHLKVSHDDINIDEYNKILLSRLIANMPFLLRMKGTRSGLQQILNIFGFSQNLIRITEFINQKTGQVMEFKKLSPSYHIKENEYLTINIPSSGVQGIVIYFRPNSNKYKFEIQDAAKIIDYDDGDQILIIGKQYCVVFVNEDNIGVAKFYKNGNLVSEDTTDNGTKFNFDNDIFLKIYGDIYLDNVRTINNTTNIDDYIKGVGFKVDQTEIVSKYDFNSFSDIKIFSGSLSGYSDDNVSLDSFQSIEYSQIFNVANTPSKFFTITPADEVGSISVVNDKYTHDKDNLPFVHIGSFYSDIFNAKFINNYFGNFNNLIDNSEEDWDNYFYSGLQTYKKEYNSDYETGSITNNFNKMTRFYQEIDSSMFEIIESFIPANIHYGTGVVLDNNILNRPKLQKIAMVKSNVNDFKQKQLKYEKELVTKKIKKHNPIDLTLINSDFKGNIIDKSFKIIINDDDIFGGVSENIKLKKINNSTTQFRFKNQHYGQATSMITEQERNMIIDMDGKLGVTSFRIPSSASVAETNDEETTQ